LSTRALPVVANSTAARFSVDLDDSFVYQPCLPGAEIAGCFALEATLQLANVRRVSGVYCVD
jgi:hypothetical protein